MSALSFARQAFGREKPHSSITDWVDILTSSNIEEEAYDGIPELVDSINLQAAGPAEASRALRKKLKHGNPHQQYRALVLLKALVENCGQRFQATFADSQLTDALKNLASDPSTDKKVYKKLLLVLGSWRDQFKGDPSMTLVAGLYKQCRGEGRRLSQQEVAHMVGISPTAEDKKKTEREQKEEAKRKAKQEKQENEKRRREEEERRRKERTEGNKPKRALFPFEKEKPKVLTSIADASHASSNLVNAITLVNRDTDSLQTNDRVQDCLTNAKQARKAVVKYIQVVENEEIIGTLIEANERIMAAIEMYDRLSAQDAESAAVAVTTGLATTQISSEQENSGLQLAPLDRVRNEKGREKGQQSNSPLHPDLQELSFGPLGASSNDLPPPLRPSTRPYHDSDDALTYDGRGSLADFSDYDSSEEEEDPSGPFSSKTKDRWNHLEVSDGSDDYTTSSRTTKHQAVDDPFADPFADEVATGLSRK